jgi:hypothetical protein
MLPARAREGIHTRPTRALALYWAVSAGLRRAAAGRKSQAGRLPAMAKASLDALRCSGHLRHLKGSVQGCVQASYLQHALRPVRFGLLLLLLLCVRGSS